MLQVQSVLQSVAVFCRCAGAVASGDLVDAFACQTVVVQYPALQSFPPLQLSLLPPSPSTSLHLPPPSLCLTLPLLHRSSLKLVHSFTKLRSFLKAFQAQKEENW